MEQGFSKEIKARRATHVLANGKSDRRWSERREGCDDGYHTLDISVTANTAAHVANGHSNAKLAITKAFGTAEVLEHIISYLPMQDILLAQLVNRQFRDAIKGSLRLKKLLFVEREINARKTTGSGATTDSVDIRFNPLLRHMPVFSVYNMYYMRPFFMSLILEDKYTKHLPELANEAGPFQAVDGYFKMAVGKQKRRRRPRLMHRFSNDESWRRMYVTQPPCPILVEVEADGAVYILDKNVYTMAELADLVQLLEGDSGDAPNGVSKKLTGREAGCFLLFDFENNAEGWIACPPDYSPYYSFDEKLSSSDEDSEAGKDTGDDVDADDGDRGHGDAARVIIARMLNETREFLLRGFIALFVASALTTVLVVLAEIVLEM